MSKFDQRGKTFKAGQLLRPLNVGKKPRAEKYSFQEVRLPVSILPTYAGSGTKFKSAGKNYQITTSGAIVRINKKRKAGKVRNANEAIDDVLATSAIFDAMKKLYKDMPEDRSELQAFCNNGKETIDLAGKFTRNEAGNIFK